MTPDHLPFLRSVLSDPAADGPRLVYADWLEERGEAERAEFIRVQVELAKQPTPYHCPKCGQKGRRRRGVHFEHEMTCANFHDWKPGPVTHDTLRRRERELWHRLPTVATFAKWATGLSTDPGVLRFWLGNQSGPLLTVRRGFVASVTCTADDWLRHADEIYWEPGQTAACPDCTGRGGYERPCPVTAQPIGEVTLTTWPDELSTGWRFDDFSGGSVFGIALRPSGARGRVRVAVGGSPDYAAVVQSFVGRWPRIKYRWPISGGGHSTDTR